MHKENSEKFNQQSNENSPLSQKGTTINEMASSESRRREGIEGVVVSEKASLVRISQRIENSEYSR